MAFTKCQKEIFMKLMSKADNKELQNLMRRKYTYEADAVFQFLCVNEELQGDARYKRLKNA